MSCDDAIGEHEVSQHRARATRRWIVANDSTVAAALERVDGPVVGLVANGRFAEEVPPVGRDIEVVGDTKAESSTMEPQLRLVSSVTL